jgi:hypothetical protein
MGARVTFAFAFLFTAVLFINFCAWFYACGCQSLWAGAAEHCNIHQPHAKHCPWCAIGTAGSMTVFGAIVLAQAAVSYRWRASGWPLRLLLSLAAFPVAGTVLGLLTGWWTGYWS